MISCIYWREKGSITNGILMYLRGGRINFMLNYTGLGTVLFAARGNMPLNARKFNHYQINCTRGPLRFPREE